MSLPSLALAVAAHSSPPGRRSRPPAPNAAAFTP